MKKNQKKLRIYSIFKSIDGEVNHFHQGRISTFIRFAGCNLNPPCLYCFGIRPGRRIPRIILSRFPNKKIFNIKKGDKLLTFDDKSKLVETVVTQILQREVDIWFTIKIENHIYFVTEEHPFFTTRGLITARNLKVGDMILHATPKDKISFSKEGIYNPMKRKEVAAKSAANTDYKEIGRKISIARIANRKKGWKPRILLSNEAREALNKSISERMKGENNPNWKGGVSVNLNYYKIKTKLKKNNRIGICENCGEIKKLDVHHIDGTNNDDIANLEKVCHSCHSLIHKIGYNFWNGKRKDKKTLQAKNGKEVISIKRINRYDFPPSIRPKPLKVYNLTCRPYNSYLIDYMWVHNCDTKYALKRDSGNEMSVNQIMEKVKELKCKNITITGGEPLMQHDGFLDLTKALWKDDYKVSVETNGCYTPHGINIGCWVVDYKLSNSGVNKNLMMELIQWANLRRCDFVKFVISTWSDFNEAIDTMKNLKECGCLATFAFSPAHGILDPHDLIRWLDLAKINNVVINLQLHKYLNLIEDQ